MTVRLALYLILYQKLEILIEFFLEVGFLHVLVIIIAERICFQPLEVHSEQELTVRKLRNNHHQKKLLLHVYQDLWQCEPPQRSLQYLHGQFRFRSSVTCNLNYYSSHVFTILGSMTCPMKAFFWEEEEDFRLCLVVVF